MVPCSVIPHPARTGNHYDCHSRYERDLTSTTARTKISLRYGGIHQRWVDRQLFIIFASLEVGRLVRWGL